MYFRNTEVPVFGRTEKLTNQKKMEFLIRGRGDGNMLSFASFAGKGLGGGGGTVTRVGSRVKWRSPPPSASWAENTIITARKRENCHLQSMTTF